MTGAYAHLNLRQNPFGELEPHHRAALAVVDLGAVLDHLAEPHTAVEFVGPCGHGKSTHLHALRRALPDAHYARLWTDEPDPSGLSGTLLLDELDAVGPWRRLRLLHCAERLAIGVHRSHHLTLRLHGFRVLTIRVADPDPARIGAILRRRIAFCRLDDGPIPTLDDATVRTLCHRHGANVRAMESTLYDAVRAMTEVTHVTL